MRRAQVAERDRDVRLTEPEIVQCLYLTGMGVEISESVVRFVGWTQLPAMGSDHEERRVVVRFAMSNTQARDLQNVMRKAFARGGH
jgi:hypothetical protein